jgi:hypothetical protein
MGANKLKIKISFKKFMVVFLTISLITSISPISSSFASIELGPEINLSSSETNSQNVQITDEGILYVVWKEGKEIFFKRSIDNGLNFIDEQDLSGTSSVTSKSPQIAASGNNVGVVWEESGEINIATSTNNGTSFDLTNLSNNVGASQSPQISMSDSNIYVVWQDSTDGKFDILFTKSENSGASFTAPLNISALHTDNSIGAQISVDNSNIFVVWSDDTPNGFGSADVLLSSSTSAGDSFGTTTNLSNSNSDSTTPQVAASGTNVFVVWNDGGEIKIKSSEDGGNSFSSATNLSNNQGFSQTPQIALSGANAHVVWQDASSGSGDILYSNNADYSNVINLSANDGLSSNPQISASGSNVIVVWNDKSFSTEEDILLRSSYDGGSTFSSFQQVSDNSGKSTVPQIFASGNNVHIAWVDKTPGNNDIFYKSGTVSSSSIIFDELEYGIGQAATITVIDASANLNSGSAENLIVELTSDSDSEGISLTLNETDLDSGTFSNSFSLTSDVSNTTSKHLHVQSNDVITAKTLEGATGSASILPVSITFDSPNYDFGDIGKITVIDESANTNPFLAENVTAIITSQADPLGKPLTLIETGSDTGEFKGETIFMIGNSTLEIQDDEYPTVTVCSEITGAKGSGSLDTFVESDSDPIGITFTLTETGPSTGFFEGTLTFSPDVSDSDSAIIEAAPGDYFKHQVGDFNTRGIIHPNNDPSRGAITVANFSNELQCTDTDEINLLVPLNPDVTASYGIFSTTSSVDDRFASGGGGGGLVRPSLVVNALAGIGGSGGGSAYSSPQLQVCTFVQLGWLDVPLEVEQICDEHDSTNTANAYDLGYFEDFDYPFVINDKGFILSGFTTTLETQTLNTNTPHTIKFIIYESEIIQHLSIYINLRDSIDEIHESDTQILYNANQELQTVDPNGFFNKVSMTVNELEDNKKEVVLEITFAKEMDTSHIIVRSWDPNFYSGDTHILDALEIVSDVVVESPITTYEEPVIEELKSQTIPIWVKNNAAWWSEQQIDDDDFIAGIEYLIKNGVINIPGVEVTGSDSTEIPDWIKNNAGWWSESLITDDDFIEAMQWLISNGVIQI